MTAPEASAAAAPIAAYYEGQRRIRIGPASTPPPAPGEVQLRVSHCGICGTDLHIYHGAMDARVRFPQIMGHECSGRVAALGAGVERADLPLGQPVTVMPLASCGQCAACQAGLAHICYELRFLGIDTPGAFQTHWNVPAQTVFPLPAGLSLRHGALLEPLAVACHDVRLGEVSPGQQVVVLGGGPIGALVALVARQKGASVLLSEINPFRLDLARSLGFDAINPLEQDLPAATMERTRGAGADVVFEVSAAPAAAAVMTELLRARGLAVVVAIYGQPAPLDLFRFFWRELQMRGARVYERQDFQEAIALAAAGALPLDALISETRPLRELAPSFRELESGGDKLKILLEI